MLPIEVACPHQEADLTNCGASEFEQCRVFDVVTATWKPYIVNGEQGTHAERIAAAAIDGKAVASEAFAQAVTESGLV